METWPCKRVDDDTTPGGTNTKEVKPLAPSVAKRYFGKEASKMMTYGVDGSGSCFFHSIMVAMNPYNFRNRSVRTQKKLAEEFRCKAKDIDTPVFRALSKAQKADYVKRLCEPKTWAENVMISHTRDLLGLNLVFLNDQCGFNVYCGIAGDPKEPMVIVRWVSKSHFEPIVRRNADGSLQGLFDPSEASDKGVVDSVMKQVRAQCKRN